MPDIFYRVFYYRESQPDRPFEKGGVLYVSREHQGDGRHDIQHDGILYCAVEPVSAVSERIKQFRNRKIDNTHFVSPDGQKMALAKICLAESRLVDLRDARMLVEMKVAPYEIATLDRDVTQKVSEMIYEKGKDGFFWWSTLEAKWSNATLYLSRVAKRLTVVEPPVVLNTKSSVVIEAAGKLNIELA